jgi:hypothetical protein
LVVTIVAMWRARHRHAGEAALLHPAAVLVILTAAMLIAAAHLIAQYFGPAEISRIGVLRRYSTLISIENLLWPLLVQILVLQRNAVGRLQVLAALLPIIALSPYRGPWVAVMVFGFLIGLAAVLWRAARAGWPWPLVRRGLIEAVIVVVVSGCLGSALYFDSKNRNLSSFQDEAERLWRSSEAIQPDKVHARLPAAEVPRLIRASLEPAAATGEFQSGANPRFWKDIAQRTVHPLYQAAMVEKLAATRRRYVKYIAKEQNSTGRQQ